MGLDLNNRTQESMDLQDRPNCQPSWRILSLFNMTLVLAFEFKPSLNCIKKKRGYGRPFKPNKNQQTMRSIDAPKFGVPHRQSNLGISPQASLTRVSKSSLDTKKKQDFQYFKDKGKPLTILALLAQGTSS